MDDIEHQCGEGILVLRRESQGWRVVSKTAVVDKLLDADFRAALQLWDDLVAAMSQALRDALEAAEHGKRTAVFYGKRCLYVLPAGGDRVIVNLGRYWEPSLVIQAYAREYGLTTGEAEVLQSFVTGKTPAQIADARRVGLATVRTQIGQIMRKTGFHRGDDLILAVMLQPAMIGRLS